MSDSIPQAIEAVEAALAAEREEQEAWSKSPFTGAFDWVVVRDKLIDEIRNHGPTLLAAAKESASKDAEIERLRAAMCDAMTDIQQWMQLARRQREEMPNVNHCPYGPNEAGIEASDRVLGKCRAALSGRPPSEEKQ